MGLAAPSIPKSKIPGGLLTRGSVTELVAASSMQIRGRVNPKNELQSVLIRISGAAAKIPSMKNRKIPGTNFTNPSINRRIKALDALFLRNKPDEVIRKGFGTDPVHVLIACGTRSSAFDDDGVFTTVRDWLEPATKPVGRTTRKRGWGIGLVENDFQISGYPLHSRRCGLDTPDTLILIQRLSLIQQDISVYVRHLLTLAGEELP